jgi:hypothetical protein
MKGSENSLEESQKPSDSQLRSEFSSSTLNSRNSGSSISSTDSGNDGMNGNNNKTTSSESLNALLMEEALVFGELNDIQQLQFSDCDDVDDQDLREFQRIEREIKISELTKCLQMVQKQINNYTKNRELNKSDV